jgi:hypothetical protein
MLNQTFMERLVARDYYVSDAPDFLPFVEPRPLTEPDKRLSHTSGSSVRSSVSTTGKAGGLISPKRAALLATLKGYPTLRITL